MDLVEDGGQEDRGRRDIQGRQVERRFIRPVRGRQNWLTQALRWAAAPSWRRMAETNHDGCEQECGCWEEGFADALAGMQEWSITVHDGICRCEFCVTGIALIEAALGDMAGILPPHPVRHRSRRSGSAQTPPPHRPGPGFTHRVLFREERSRSARGPHVFHHSPVGVGFIGGPGLDVAQVVGGDG